MTGTIDAERILDAFLAPEHDQLADRVLDAALADIARIPQRRALRVPWRFPNMSPLLRIALVALVLVAAVGGGAVFLAGGGVGPTPTPTVAPTPTPTAAPTPAPTEAPDALKYDKATWTPYTSAQYGFTTAIPPGWRVDHAATRPFDPGTDNDTDPGLPSVDTFINAEGSVAVGMWQVPDGMGVNPSSETREDYEAWAQQLCLTMHDSPCTGIADRSIPMCRESADCHPALIVPFNDDVFGYFLGNQVAVVWHGEAAPEVTDYGGATNVLKAFLRARNVHTPNPGQGE
jgi:hypothetical protein